MKEARYYETRSQGTLCQLCPKHCLITEGQAGFCRVRHNVGGKLYTANYAGVSAYALDPIEKKPLYHFYPGSMIFSIGTWGCNFACKFCQNWEIAQDSPQIAELSPEQIVAMAVKAGHGNIGIAYTYSEPSVWYEYILDTAKLAQAAGLKNILVTNGFINDAPLRELLPFIDAMNIDVKAFNDEFYHRICAGRLSDVKRTVEQAATTCHVEITTLVVPGLNDDQAELSALAKWLASVNSEIPLHFSRYYPQYKMSAPPTPIATLHQAFDQARQHLDYVYLGNVGNTGVNTHCPQCNKLVIDRIQGISNLTSEKTCSHCGHSIAIVGESFF